jgi:hypothetical protein
MALSVKENEAPDPHDVRLLRARTEMASPHRGTDSIEKLRRLIHVSRLPRKWRGSKFSYEP